jgi:hypothetical protein
MLHVPGWQTKGREEEERAAWAAREERASVQPAAWARAFSKGGRMVGREGGGGEGL